jgi:16S rRNA (guanine(1405)-N(7))-methyltransferase
MAAPEVPNEKLEAIENALAKSRRYAAVSPDTVRRVARKALLATRGDVGEAVKRTKRGLHEIHGAYLPPGAPNYDSLARSIRSAADSGDEEKIKADLRSAMAVHASTRERIPYLGTFYQEIFARVPEPATIRDLACGLNPLATPWMPVGKPVTYLASDIDERMLDFVGQALTALGVAHRVEIIDLVDAQVTGYADLTLLLKTIPCLERQKTGAGWELLDAINSPTIIVTFPTRSLGQRSKGMFQTYSSAFEEYLGRGSWRAEQVEIPNELVYIVTK